jgi:uncharacterized repeat protein (TIGR02543 family)
VASGNTVTVTGNIDATRSPDDYLTLNIDASVKVVWKATLKGTTVSGKDLIYISGGSGVFEVQDGGTIQNDSAGVSIRNNSACAVNVSDGTVSSKNGTAIHNNSTGVVNISGGTVSSESGTAIHNNSIGAVNISGGTVSAKTGNAVYNASTGVITISGATTKVTSARIASAYGTIYLANSGTATTARLVITGGTVENTATNTNGCALAVYNASSGAVNVSGGAVSSQSGSYAIYNYIGYNVSSNTINISGGTVSSIYTEGYNSYYFGTVTVSGGIVGGGARTAIYSTTGVVNISSNAKITSTITSSNNGTIYLSGSTLNVSGGTVENIAMGTDAYAIYISSNSTINVSGSGIVESENGHAIHCYTSTNTNSNAIGTVNVSGGTVSSVNGQSGIWIGKGTVKITGGSVKAINGYAVNTGENVAITIGGNPTIIGQIYTHTEKLSVLTIGTDIFNPMSKIYELVFSEYATRIAVMNGGNFLSSFKLYSEDWTLKKNDADIAMVKAYKISLNSNTGDNSFPFPESFENTTHGWTFVNGSQTNKWIRGTATYNSGSYSAYISNNSSANSYTLTSKSTVHLYKDIAFPTSSSDFTMTFYFKGYGEYNSIDYDYMTVRYSTTSYTPSAGSIFTNGTQLGTNYLSNSSWTKKTIILPSTTFSGKTMRLVFSWINDNSSGTQPPAAIDDINISGLSSITTVATDADGRLASLPTPKRAGYDFSGWFTAATGGTQVTTSKVFSENTTIYAQWIPTSPTTTTYTVTFNPNGGTVMPTSATVTAPTGSCGTLASFPTPTRTGNYTFDGWYTAATGGTLASSSICSNTTFYAHWTSIPESPITTTYTVTFNPNSGVVTPTSATVTVTTGSCGTLTSSSFPTPTRAGNYTFDGWYTAAIGGTQASSSICANTTFYAHWTPIPEPPPTPQPVNASNPIIFSQPIGGTVTVGNSHTLSVSTNNGRNITVLMRDSYADGWNNAALRITVNGVNLSTNPTVSSNQSGTNNYTFNASVGDVVAVYWNKGSDDRECAFAIYYTDAPPSSTFNPASGASNNTEALLVYKQYSSLGSTTTGTLLGTFTVPNSGSGTLSYQWYTTTSTSAISGTSITSATDPSYDVPTSTAGTYHYYVVVTNTITNNGDGGQKTASVMSTVATVTINSAVNAAIPSIISQPTGGTVTVGGTHRLSVSASVSDNGTLSYQWYRTTSASATGGTSINGATSSSYSAPTSTADTYRYYVVVKNTITNNGDGGQKTADITSTVATITVHPIDNAVPPTITTQPTGGAVTVGGNRELSVSASVNGNGMLSYQWYRNTSSSTMGGTAISGATSSTYSVPMSTVGTYYYYVVVMNAITDNGDGGQKTASVTSNVATVTVNSLVNAAIPTITAQPEGGTVSVDESFTVSVRATSSDDGTLSYVWYDGDDDIVGTGSSYSVSTSTPGTYYYYVVVTNTITDNGDGGQKFASVTSESITVTVKYSNAVKSSDRTIPTADPSAEAAVVSPVSPLTAEFTAGPNPVMRSSGKVNFFRNGSRVAYATLSIYDASGSVVRKIRVIDDAVGSQSRRKVSSWNLRDSKGRLVSDGTYVVKGVLKTSGGNRERVSVVVGVR